MNNEMQVLENMNALAVNPPTDVELAKVKEPLERVEDDLSKFTSDILDIVRTDVQTQRKIDKAIENRLDLDEKDGGFTNNQLIAVQLNYNTNLNDRISKVLGPTFQLMTAKQQAIYAAKAAESKNPNITINTANMGNDQMRQVNEAVTPEVLQGLTAFNNLISRFSQQKKDDPTIASAQPTQTQQ